MKELLEKAVDKVLSDCLNLRRYEVALILCDSTGFEIGNVFYEKLVNRCKETVLTVIQVRKEDGDELPEPIMMLLKQFDIAVIITDKQIPAGSIKSALSQCGVRAAIMSGISSEVLSRTAYTDWRRIGVYTRRIAAQLSAAKKVTIVSGNSFEFTINKVDVPASVDDGRLSSPGAIGSIPAGEVSLQLAGCSCNGILSINGSFLHQGTMMLLKQPLVIEVQDGVVRKIYDHPDAAFLEKKFSLYKQARVLSEFGVGTLETAIVSGNLVEDRKSSGSIHVTFGNAAITKQNFSAVGVTVKADVKLDDKIWIRDGALI